MLPPSRIALLLLTALLFVGLLSKTQAIASDPASACLEAASAAERNWTLPPDLIHAIGRSDGNSHDAAGTFTGAPRSRASPPSL